MKIDTPEIWKLHPGYSGQYEVSDQGRVKSLARVLEKRSRWGGTMLQHYPEKLLSLTQASDGYVFVRVGGRDGRSYPVHRMVLETFVGPCPDGMEACHNNGINNDNWLSNLRWDTHLANNRDRKLHGTYLLGEHHPMAKIAEDDVKRIWANDLSIKQIMAEYGLSRTHAHRIRRRKCWEHLDAAA